MNQVQKTDASIFEHFSHPGDIDETYFDILNAD